MTRCSRCTSEACLCAYERGPRGPQGETWQVRAAPLLERYGESLCDVEGMGWSQGEWAVFTSRRVYYPDRTPPESEILGWHDA